MKFWRVVVTHRMAVSHILPPRATRKSDSLWPRAERKIPRCRGRRCQNSAHRRAEGGARLADGRGRARGRSASLTRQQRHHLESRVRALAAKPGGRLKSRTHFFKRLVVQLSEPAWPEADDADDPGDAGFAWIRNGARRLRRRERDRALVRQGRAAARRRRRSGLRRLGGRRPLPGRRARPASCPTRTCASTSSAWRRATATRRSATASSASAAGGRVVIRAGCLPSRSRRLRGAATESHGSRRVTSSTMSGGAGARNVAADMGRWRRQRRRLHRRRVGAAAAAAAAGAQPARARRRRRRRQQYPATPPVPVLSADVAATVAELGTSDRLCARSALGGGRAMGAKVPAGEDDLVLPRPGDGGARRRGRGGRRRTPRRRAARGRARQRRSLRLSTT